MFVYMKRTLKDSQKVVGYIRVSTEDQHLGPEAQRTALEMWCKAQGKELVSTWEDTLSGGTEISKRPGLLAAIDDLESKGAGILLIHKRDRLARDNIIAAMGDRLVERAGAVFQTVDGVANGHGPEAQLMRGLIDLFAQYERALIKVRTANALAVKRAKQERIGMIPLGSQLAKDNVHIEKNDSETKAISLVHKLKSEGFSIRSIADKLNELGVEGRGAKWHATTVARILKREPVAEVEVETKPEESELTVLQLMHKLKEQGMRASEIADELTKLGVEGKRWSRAKVAKLFREELDNIAFTQNPNK